jgi:methyl-accepting chemotaxis protein
MHPANSVSICRTTTSRPCLEKWRNALWWPGLWLFGLLPFRGKALLISSCFALPLALPVGLYGYRVAGDYRELVLEMQGAQVLLHAQPVIQSIQRMQILQERSATDRSDGQPAWTAAREELALRLKDLVAAQANWSAGANPSLNWKQFKTSVGGVISGELSASPMDSALGPSQALQAMWAFQTEIVQASRLTVDADELASLLVVAAIVEAPDLLLTTADASKFAALLLTRDDQSLLRLLVDRMARMEVSLDRMERAYVRAAALNPDSIHALGADQALSSLRELLRVARVEVIEGGGSVKASDFHLLADRHTVQAYALVQRTLLALQEALALRQRAMLQSLVWVSVLAVVCLLLALYCFACFYFVISKGNRTLMKYLGALSLGQLQLAPPRPKGNDETASLLRALSKAHAALRILMANLAQAAGSFDVASGEVAAATADLAARTEQAAVFLERQRASICGLGVTAKTSAIDAERASCLAQSFAISAERSGRVFSEVVLTMSDIRTASKRIADITGVIDGIALQTHILALNATVEAARAGDSGRGFSVVATEVRRLAMRSAAAAHEIRDLIEMSVARADAGSAVVQDARTAIAEVADHAEEIVACFCKMAEAAAFQAAELAEISARVSELDHDTQQNAALVEQTSVAVASLRENAGLLRHSLDAFKLS